MKEDYEPWGWDDDDDSEYYRRHDTPDDDDEGPGDGDDYDRMPD